MYQIGSLIFPKPDDLLVEDYWEAIKKAEELSVDDGVYGVWTSQEEGSDLLAIIYGEGVFIK